MPVPVIVGRAPRLKARVSGSDLFSGALISQAAITGSSVLAPSASIEFGSTANSAPSPTVAYDTDSYWNGTSRRLVIPADGYYRVFFSTEVSFESGGLGDADNPSALLFFDDGVGTNLIGEASWEVSIFALNHVEGSHFLECHIAAAVEIGLVFSNTNTDLNMVWDNAAFGITRIALG